MTESSSTSGSLEPRGQEIALGRQKVVRWIVRGIVAVLSGIVLMACIPRFLSWPVAHHWLFEQATGDIQGTARAGSVRLRWFDLPEFQDVRVSSAEDETTLEISRCMGDQTLWDRLWKRGDLGRFRIEQPTLSYLLDAKGQSNFTRTFSPRSPKPSDAPDSIALAAELARHVSIMLDIVDGKFRYQANPEYAPWELGPIATTIGLQTATADRGATVVLEKGRIVDRLELTPEICHDLMKFIAPVLADVAWTEGRFTLDVEPSRIPLADPRQAEFGGTLFIHAVRVGPGPTVSPWLEMANLPSSITLIEDSPVKFVLEKGRVHHEGLQFHAGDVRIATSGFVGLDESLDLIAEIQLPTWDLPDRPILTTLSGRSIRIPVRGTLDQPQVDRSAIRDDTTHLALDSLRSLVPEMADDESWETIVAGVQELGNRIRERREQRAANSSSEKAADDGNQPPAEVGRRRPLRRLLRSLVPIETDTTAPPETPGEEQRPIPDREP